MTLNKLHTFGFFTISRYGKEFKWKFCIAFRRIFRKFSKEVLPVTYTFTSYRIDHLGKICQNNNYYTKLQKLFWNKIRSWEFGSTSQQKIIKVYRLSI